MSTPENARDSVVRISINDTRFELLPDTDIPALKAEIEAAVRENGAFVDFTVTGGYQVSALIGSPCDVFLTVGPREPQHEMPAAWVHDTQFDV